LISRQAGRHTLRQAGDGQAERPTDRCGERQTQLDRQAEGRETDRQAGRQT